MDGLSGAASFLTVFRLALSSTQVIYNTVGGIKNAPATIQHMISSLQDLSNLLKQLRGCTEQFHLAADLGGLVGKCAADLKEFEEKLAKLNIPADNKAVRLWKNIKVTLRERDLVKISGLIQQHVAALSLQMQIIEDTRGSSHTMSLERVEALSHTQIALSTKSSSTLESTKIAVDQVNNNIQALGTTANASHQDTCLALEQLGNKVQQLSGLSTTQSENLGAIYELLKQQLWAKHQQPVGKASRHEAVSPGVAETFEEMNLDGKEHDSSDDDDGLLRALGRLCQFAKEKEKTVFSEDAETIINDVQHICDLLIEAVEDRSVKEMKGKRPRSSYESDKDNNLLYRQEAKRIKGLLTASHCISINEKASRPLALAMARYKTKSTHCERSSRYGTITVRARRKYRIIGPIPQDCTQDTQNDTPEILDISFAFLPNIPQTPRIAVDFQQRMSYEGSFLKKPALSVSALLPRDSEVFRLILNGDLDGLIKSLSLREAFLTDRDCDGRCLLNYAIYSKRPDICKFLIDKGANVDFIEPSQTRLDPMHSLQLFSRNECEACPDEQALINRCRLQLFEAGADPTLYNEEDPEADCFVTHALAESIQLLLDHLHYLQIASTIEAELWLKYHLDSKWWAVGSIALLLRRQGKNGLPIQNLEGCLHSAIFGSQCSDHQDDQRETLIMLIRAGANVYAKDRFGRSVSHIACCPETEWRDIRDWRRRDNHDLRLREIWTEALSACGFDAEEVISTSMPLEELSDSDNDSMSDQYEESDSAESDCSGTVVNNPTSLISEIDSDNDSMSDQHESDSAESDCSGTVVNNPTSLISEIDSDNDSMSDQHEESGSAELDCSENVVHNPTSLISEIGSPEYHYNDMFWQTDPTLEAAAQIDTFRQTDYVVSNQYERSLLEGGAHIGTIWQPDYVIPNQYERSLSESDAQINTLWQTDSPSANQYDLSLLEGDAQIWGN